MDQFVHGMNFCLVEFCLIGTCPKSWIIMMETFSRNWKADMCVWSARSEVEETDRKKIHKYK